MFGIDYLGGAKYSELVLREHPGGWAAGVFGKTVFGDPGHLEEALLQSGRCPRLRIQAVWTEHEYNPRIDDPIIFEELKKANFLKAKFPNADIRFSPICENNLRGKPLRDFAKKIEARNGGLTLVNSYYHGEPLPGWISEVHGSTPAPHGPYDYSFDGDNCVDEDCQSRKLRHLAADTFYFWHPSLNGLLNNEDTTPREKRKAWPTSALLDSLIYLKNSKGEFRELPNDWIYKSHADRHIPDPLNRSYEPLLISPVSAQFFELVTSNGQVVAKSGPRGKYTDGRPLYRFEGMGFQLAEKAVRIQGSPVVSLRANGKLWGRINPAFRAGDYR